MSIYLLHLAFHIFNIKYFESDSVKLKSYHHSFHLPFSIGIISTKELLILERLFRSQWDSKTKAENTDKDLMMTP